MRLPDASGPEPFLAYVTYEVLDILMDSPDVFAEVRFVWRVFVVALRTRVFGITATNPSAVAAEVVFVCKCSAAVLANHALLGISGPSLGLGTSTPSTLCYSPGSIYPHD